MVGGEAQQGDCAGAAYRVGLEDRALGVPLSLKSFVGRSVGGGIAAFCFRGGAPLQKGVQFLMSALAARFALGFLFGRERAFAPGFE
jgi:hypothetical protein